MNNIKIEWEILKMVLKDKIKKVIDDLVKTSKCAPIPDASQNYVRLHDIEDELRSRGVPFKDGEVRKILDNDKDFVPGNLQDPELPYYRNKK